MHDSAAIELALLMMGSYCFAAFVVAKFFFCLFLYLLSLFSLQEEVNSVLSLVFLHFSGFHQIEACFSFLMGSNCNVYYSSDGY